MKFRLKPKKNRRELLNLQETLKEIQQQTFVRMKVRATQRPMWKGKRLEPVLPPDLTTLDDVQIGILYSQFSCMAQYVQQHLAVRTVERSITQKLDVWTRAKVRMEKTGTNPDKEAKTDMDRRSQMVGQQLLLGEGVEVMTDAILKGYMLGRETISREMSRRQWSRERAT